MLQQFTFIINLLSLGAGTWVYQSFRMHKLHFAMYLHIVALIGSWFWLSSPHLSPKVYITYIYLFSCWLPLSTLCLPILCLCPPIRLPFMFLVGAHLRLREGFIWFGVWFGLGQCLRSCTCIFRDGLRRSILGLGVGWGSVYVCILASPVMVYYSSILGLEMLKAS